MNVTLKIRYNSPAGIVTQGGTFPLKRRKPEQVAYEWLQEIKREVNYEGFVQVTVDEEDITEKVKSLGLK
ncbi:hypothetical protein [Mesobacillus foraminis]|uniref:Uncharacterized protein n=1 Tax=Mesobacillus foraminis TaxID=279826 RepID=A0A4R2BHG6_9BACI|nr:hypothetical protein [Mesobacillus foraminis]TCN25469.1 hypothetical protein EV146_105126 [Mesobacillus foraminis]